MSKMWREALRRASSAIPREAKSHSRQMEYLQEPCIAVDEEDHMIGHVSKESAHRSDSSKHLFSELVVCLHRAFSVFAFTPNRRLILQRRSLEKITFPGLWTNTCCSHPLFNKREMGDGEAAVKGIMCAARRKLAHEVGLDVPDPGSHASHLSEPFTYAGRFIYKVSSFLHDRSRR